MANIEKKSYELSLWEDYCNDGYYYERKLFVFGSNEMTNQSRAVEPKFTQNINGTNKLSFKMYSHYYDNATGEYTNNPYVAFLKNESKIKLFYENNWYDFIIKNIVEHSTNKTYTYEAEDICLAELSKTGFNIELATELQNNMGTIDYLGSKILEGTNWAIDTSYSDVIIQTQKELVFKMKLNTNINAYALHYDPRLGIVPASEHTTIPVSSGEAGYIYGFYSCCANSTNWFQFIWLDGAAPVIDSEGIVENGTQYYIANVTYTDGDFGVAKPNFIGSMSLVGYRGKRFVFNQERKFDPILNQVLYKYDKDGYEYWGYSKTEYSSAKLVTNYTTNPSEFKSTSGWISGCYAKTSSGTITNNNPILDADTLPSIKEKLASGAAIGDADNYEPILHIHNEAAGSTTTKPMIINTGFRDSRSAVKEIGIGEQFVCYCKLKYKNTGGIVTGLPAGLNVKVVRGAYDPTTARYPTPTAANTYFNFDFNNFIDIAGTGYAYCTSPALLMMAEKEFKANANQMNIYVTVNESTINDWYISDFQIFRYVAHSTLARPLLPTDDIISPQVLNKYYYFSVDAEYETADELAYDTISINEDPNYEKVIDLRCKKIASISAKESNRFNLIQELCEAFECWASFEIEHTAEGELYSSLVRFHNYIGQENPIDFVYGIDVKDIQRTIDSKSIITKLIVKPNSNEYAPNGFCTIATAQNNPTGETDILNFDYYINQGLINKAELDSALYTAFDGKQKGYYTQLKELNNQLQLLSEKSVVLSASLTRAKADVELYKLMQDATTDKIATLDQTLLSGYGLTYLQLLDANPSGDAQQQQIYAALQNDTKLASYLTEHLQLSQSFSSISEKLIKLQVQYNNCKLDYDTTTTSINTLQSQKSNLIGLFNQIYSRFIQEGTWNDESYTNPELYFYDAQATALESAQPKVTYTINVMSLGGLEEYDGRKFKLGDRTHVQDTEFFGYTIVNNIRTPARQPIIVTEVSYALDEPDKTTIKVQTYQEQFQTLFQKVGATVQQVQYATGSYNKAADLANANTAEKVDYIQDALNDSETVITNDLDETAVWSKDGLIITDKFDASKKLKLSGGALLISNDGGITWTLSIDGSGINANKITAGQVDTKLIQITNNDEPYFRWDAFGITAYDFKINTSAGATYLNDLNTKKEYDLIDSVSMDLNSRVIVI